MQNGITAVRQFNFQREYLPTKETTWALLMAQATPELQVHLNPAAQLNKHQHGVWV